MINRCKTCHLPSNYPGISFDENGVCCFCHQSHEQFQYPGIEQLKEKLKTILSQCDSNRKYDCVVGCSGGRDSSYLLYIAKEVLNLNVLTLSICHDFMTPQARNNIKVLTEKLGVDVDYVTNDMLNKSSRKSVKTWAKHPDAAMSVTFCTGCRYGLRKLIPRYAKEKNIPIILIGDVPFEKMDYRVELLCDDRKVNIVNKLLGYSKRVLQNPAYIKTISDQFQDYISWGKDKELKEFPIRITPFYYMEWKEEEVLSKIREYGWEYDTTFNSTWRSDCYINLIRQFVYKKMVGFNDQDVYYAELLRDKKIELKDAIEKIDQCCNYDINVIKKIFKNFYDIDYEKIADKIEKKG